MPTFQRDRIAGGQQSKRKEALERLYGAGTVSPGAAGRASPLEVPRIDDGRRRLAEPPRIAPGQAQGTPRPSLGTVPTRNRVQTPEERAAQRESVKQQAAGQQQGSIRDSIADDEARAFSDIAALQRVQERERAAAEMRLQSGRAQAMRSAEGRANLGGFGLAAGTSQLLGDIGTQSDTAAIAELAEMRMRQRAEQETTLQNQVNRDDLEESSGADLDQDGDINGVPIDEWRRDENREGAAEGKLLAFEELAPKLQGGGTKQLSLLPKTSGSKLQPFVVPPEGAQTMENLGTLVDTREDGSKMYKGPDGLFYWVEGYDDWG